MQQPPAAQLQHQPEHHHHNVSSYTKPWQSRVFLLLTHRRLQSRFLANHSYYPKPQTQQLMFSNSINHQFYHHKGKNAKKIPSKQPHTIKRQKNPPYPFRLAPCNMGEFPGPEEMPHFSQPGKNSQAPQPETPADWAALNPSPPPVPPSLSQLLSDLGTPPLPPPHSPPPHHQ